MICAYCTQNWKKNYLFDSGNILKQRKGIRKHWIHCSRSLRVFRASCDATEKNSTSNRYVALTEKTHEKIKTILKKIPKILIYVFKHKFYFLRPNRAKEW